MRRAVLVFAAQFVFIMLLGLQQLNVVQRDYLGASAVSFALGVLGFSLTSAIAQSKGAGPRNLVWWAYVTAGPLGICFAIFMHR